MCISRVGAKFVRKIREKRALNVPCVERLSFGFGQTHVLGVSNGLEVMVPDYWFAMSGIKPSAGVARPRLRYSATNSPVVGTLILGFSASK